MELNNMKNWKTFVVHKFKLISSQTVCGIRYVPMPKIACLEIEERSNEVVKVLLFAQSINFLQDRNIEQDA